MESTYSIYLHTNKINGKRYIGQTILPPEKRWGKDGHGYQNQYIYQDILRYGWNNFEHTILESNLTSVEADAQERYWINYFNTQYPYGYNKTPGGNGVSEDTREKMSVKAKENWTKASKERHQQQSALMTYLCKTLDRTGKNNSMYRTHRTGADAANKRAVQCIETGEVFVTVTEASKWCNNGKITLKSHIAAQIRGERKSCGKHPETGVPLHWKYIDNKE